MICQSVDVRSHFNALRSLVLEHGLGFFNTNELLVLSYLFLFAIEVKRACAAKSHADDHTLN
jgi:hypothetical protein